jgi:hypothetical protein
MNKYEWQASLRTHLPTCEQCVFRSRCTGIFRVYLELHGGEEFQPISREALLKIDPERRNFVLLAEPLLAPLRAALAAGNLPPAWEMRREVTEDRRRMVEMDFAHAGGEMAKLRFVRPGRGRAPILRTDAYDVDVEAELNIAPDALLSLFDWLRARLAEGLDALPAPVLEADAVERAVRGSVLLRGRKRVALLAARLRSRFAHPGWHLDELRWPSETTGEVAARGADGARVVLRFTLGIRGNRSQVGVDFRFAETADRAGMKAATDHLVSLLRAAQSATTSDAEAAVAP